MRLHLVLLLPRKAGLLLCLHGSLLEEGLRRLLSR